jgi:radical SAM enzyme (TIGR01210 family)
MCDLWRYTTVEDTPAGAIPAQLDLALSELDARPDRTACSVVKLYNAGSFFDPRAVPVSDFDAIAKRLVRFERVVVESHPALVGPRVDRLREALDAAGGRDRRRAALEVAMGLETANPEALALLHKGMTLEGFGRAADDLKARGVALRAFLLVHPPFIAGAEREEWLERSVDFAFDCGATAIALIPTRGGNGAMEALAGEGRFETPTLGGLERAQSLAFARARGRVLADLWDVERLAACPRCASGRVERLRRQNLEQRQLPPFACASCGGGPS